MSIWILALLASPAVAQSQPAQTTLLTANRTVPIQVSCGFDASGVALAAGKLATSFYKVQDRCKNPETDREKRNCASQVSLMLAFAGITATFTSAAASDCAASLNEPAKCAVSTAGFAGILGFVSSALIAVKGACIEDLQKDKLLQNPLDAILPKLPVPRRLRGENSTVTLDTVDTVDSDDSGFPLEDLADLRSLHDLHSLHSKARASVPLRTLPANQPQVLDDQLFQKLRDLIAAHEKRQVKIADCVFDVGLTALFLGRGIMNTVLAGQHSPCNEDDDFGDHLDEQTIACLIQVSGISSVFMLVATLITASVTACPVKSAAVSICAKDILAAISGVTALIQEGAAISLECGPEDEHAEQLDNELADSIVA